MSISVDGIISGLDTSGLISDLVSAYSRPKTLLEEEIVDYNALQTGLTGLSSRLSDLQDALEDLNTGDEIREYSVNYAETDAFIAEATGEAAEGVYSVEVSALAKSELETTQGFSDSQALGTIANGTLTVTYGGESTDITIDGTNDSLAELAAQLDDVDGLSAYVINTGVGATPYQLVVQGTETGADNTISFDTSGLGGGGTVPAFTEQTAASNAALSINGIDVESSNNTVDDAISGFSLTLTGLTTDPVDVSVSLDEDGVQDRIQTFVDSYNEIIDYVSTNSNAADDENGITAGIFNGDGGVRRILNAIQSVVTSDFNPDPIGDPGGADSLGLVGIKLDNDGKLSIDSAKFKDVLQDDRDRLINLFTDGGKFGEAMVGALDVYVDPTEGSIKARNDGIDERIDSLKDQVERWEERILSYEARLRTGFTAFESTAGALQGTAAFITSYFFSE